MKYYYISHFIGAPACSRCLLSNGIMQPDGTVQASCMVQSGHPSCPAAQSTCPLEETSASRNGCREYRFEVEFPDAPKCAACPLAHQVDFSNGDRLKCTGLTIRQFCGSNEQVLSDCPLRSADAQRKKRYVPTVEEEKA